MPSVNSTQADLNVPAEAWKNPTDFYCPRNGRMVKKGDTIQWESLGVVKTGTIIKMNKKTCEVVNAGASTIWSYSYKNPYNPMIVGKV